MPYCRACGKEVIESAEICPHCGTRIKNPPVYGGKIYPSNGEFPQMPDGTLVTGEKSIALAIVVSLFIPGFGIIYGGKVGKGVVYLILSYLLSIILVGLILWIISIVSGYKLCKLNNDIWYEFLKTQNQ